jgi:hypothetical protein
MEKAVRGTSAAENERVIALTNIRRAIASIDENTSQESKKKLIDDVNEALGRTGKNLLTIEDDIKTKVLPALDDYIGKLRYAAMQQAIIAQMSYATSRIIQLTTENMELQRDPHFGETAPYQTGNMYSPLGGPSSIGLTVEAQKLQGQLNKNNEEIAKLNEGIRFLEGPLGENPDFIGPIPPWQANQDTLDAILGVNRNKGNTNNKPDGGSAKGTPQSVIDNYKKELTELQNQYHEGAILAADYEDKLKKLNQKAFEDLAAFGWETVEKKLKKGDLGVAETLRAQARDALLAGLDDPAVAAEFDAEMEKEADEAFKAWRDAWKRYLDLKKQKPAFKEVDLGELPTKSNKTKRGQTYSERETFIDTKYLDAYKDDITSFERYKKTLEDALAVETDTGNLERIKELIDSITESIERMKLVASDLQDKVNLAKIEKELIDLKKNGLESMFSSFTTISEGVERLYNAYKSVMQLNDSTWKNEEMEEFLVKLNAIIQTLEVLKSIWAALKTVEEVYSKIKEKNAAKQMILNAGVAASEEAKASAEAKSAVAGAASSTAAIPVVGAVLAVAAVAAIIAALMAGMGKFAKGGIVGGNSYSGDNQLARVNSGEMILNAAQQRNLLAIANGKSPKGGNVQFTIRGADLVGALNNYDRLRQ